MTGLRIAALILFLLVVFGIVGRIDLEVERGDLGNAPRPVGAARDVKTVPALDLAGERAGVPVRPGATGSEPVEGRHPSTHRNAR